MYEEGMGYDQMKTILAVINESRNMAMGGNNSDNRSSQEVRRSWRRKSLFYLQTKTR